MFWKAEFKRTVDPTATTLGGAMEAEVVTMMEEAVVAATPAATPMQAEETKVAEADLGAELMADPGPTAGVATNLHGNSAMCLSQTTPISPRW